jgi:hypothetical protein
LSFTPQNRTGLSDISGGYLTLNQTELQAGLRAKWELEPGCLFSGELSGSFVYLRELSGHNERAASAPAIFPDHRTVCTNSRVAEVLGHKLSKLLAAGQSDN